MKSIKKVSVIDNHVAKKLRKFRFDAGLSQRDLAQFAGISFQQIQKYESAQNKISVAKLFEFSQILKVSMSSFFDGLIYKTNDRSYTREVFDEIGDFCLDIDDYSILITTFNDIGNEIIRQNILNLMQNIAKLDFNNKVKRNYSD